LPLGLGELVSQFLETALETAQEAHHLPEPGLVSAADLAYGLDEAVSSYLDQHSLPLEQYAELQQQVLEVLAHDLHNQGHLEEPLPLLDLQGQVDAYAVLEAYGQVLSDGAE
jgi:hypothetical protein